MAIGHFSKSILLAFFITIFFQSNANASEISKKFIRYSAVGNETFNLPETARIKVIVDKYNDYFVTDLKKKNLKKHSTDDLQYLFRATADVIFYSSDPQYVITLEEILETLESRKSNVNQQVEALFKSYVNVRAIEKAKALKLRYTNIIFEDLPEFNIDKSYRSGTKSEWVVHDDLPMLELKNVDLNKAAQIVVIGHPKCHFSTNAVQEIFADPSLKDVLAGKMKWLVPQDNYLNFNGIQQWNKLHPEAIMTFANVRSEWPEINDWSTPAFYFFKDGVLISQMTGWPRGGNKEKLVENLKKIGR